MKVLVKIILTLVLIAALLFVLGRYGWRVFGFAACDDPNANFAESVTDIENGIRIAGGTGSSFTSYVGSIYRIENGCLYLGVKHNAFLGFMQRLGGFRIDVPTEGMTVNSIYLKGGETERLIWTRAEGLIKGFPSERNMAIEGEAAVDVDIVLANYPFDAEDGESDLCAVLFLGYDETSADEAVSRLCAEYEVLHEMFLAGDVENFDAHGAEQYLILPKYLGETVTVRETELDQNGELQPVGDPLTTEKPIRIRANYSDIVPSSSVTLQYGERTVSFEPFISLKDGKIMAMDGAYTLMYGQ